MHATAVVLCSVPNHDLALSIARALVTNRLCACATAIPGCTSIYTWNNQLVEGQETQLLIKTTTRNVTALSDLITSLHPFDVPEIIVLPIEGGSEMYLQWIQSQCLPRTDHEND